MAKAALKNMLSASWGIPFDKLRRWAGDLAQLIRGKLWPHAVLFTEYRAGEEK